MKIHEYQGKQLFRNASVPVLDGHVARSPQEAAEAYTQLGGSLAVVKAQVHAGGRGKGTIIDNPDQRGVQLVKSAEEAAKVAENLLGKRLVTIQTGATKCWWKRAVRSSESSTWASSSIAERPCRS